MAISRNGWDIYKSYSDPMLVNFPWVTGKVRKGDHYTVLEYIARRFNNEVEKVDVAGSWGHNPRPVRGYTNVWSEHATGTAIDLNAPNHPIRVAASKTFSSAQIAKIREIMKDVRGAARWGGEWSRPDGMHFELIGGNVLVGKVADLIRAGKLPGADGGSTVKPAGNVKPSKPAASAPKQPDDYKDLVVDGDFGSVTVRAVQILMRAIKTYTRAVDGGWGKYTKIAVQEWLKGLGYYKRAVDGSFGKYSVTALQNFLRAKGLYPASKYVIDGDFGPATIKALQAYLNQQNGK